MSARAPSRAAHHEGDVCAPPATSNVKKSPAVAFSHDPVHILAPLPHIFGDSSTI
jgi:hypothetical protein